MCRQAFATEGSQRTPVRFISPSLPSSSRRRNRSNPVRPIDGVFSFHCGFSGSLAALENLRWDHADRRPRTCNFVLVEPCCRRTEERRERRATVRNTNFDDKFDAMGAPSVERRHAKHPQNLSQRAAKRRKPSKHQKGPRRNRNGGALTAVRLPSGSLRHACRSDELQRNGLTDVPSFIGVLGRNKDRC